MAVPDGLLIAGAIVGLVGGVVGAAAGTDNIITRIRRARQATRDSAMILDLEFGPIERFDGSDLKKYPVARAQLSNHGKVEAKDLRLESSTGWVSLGTSSLAPDTTTTVEFAVVDVHEVSMGNFTEVQPSETPYRVGNVEIRVTWRIDGTSERSAPVSFVGEYWRPPLG